MEGVEVEKLEGLEVENFCSFSLQGSSSRARENFSRSVEGRPECGRIATWENYESGSGSRRIMRVL